MKNIHLFKLFCKNSLVAKDVDPAIDYMKYIVNRMELNEEQVLWFCFLYGVTYQLPSAYLIYNEYPDLEILGVKRLEHWWDKKQQLIPFQIDKMKQRKDFVTTVKSYKKLVGKSQKRYFDDLLNSDNPQKNFDTLWVHLKGIKYFGRFSIWNWCQALKHVAGYNIEPTNLMLGESDSVSFTDGLAYAYGKFSRVTKKVDNQKIIHKWTEEEKQLMETRCAKLKNKLHIDNFQLETLACAFKKIWRTNDSRYVGYYNDRLSEDIIKTSLNWSGVDWKVLWDARKACVPKQYRKSINVDKEKFNLDPIDKCKGVEDV